MSIPGQYIPWDERRNTSRTFRPEPGSLERALKAMQRFRETDPEHAAWIAEGAPHLTQDEHIARFGYPHPGRRRK